MNTPASSIQQTTSVGFIPTTSDQNPVPQSLGLLLTLKEVAALTKFSIRYIQRLESSGRMPKKITTFGENSPRFNTSEIVAWVANGCKDVRHHPLPTSE